MSDAKATSGAVQHRDMAERSPAGDRRAAPRQVLRRLAAGSATGLTGEVPSVLRARLRLAIVIVLPGLALPSLRSFWLHGLNLGDRPPRVLLRDCEVAVLAAALALLWGRRPLSLASLRVIELAMFGLLAAY